ncbi:MAG: hypothetical protein R3310_16675 [Candidatus Competibacteraceae bacterium]|nr:hypothetical protein [Candidatus Competibacteraceae bacterium]
MILSPALGAEPVTVEFSGTVTTTRHIEEFGPGTRLSGYYIFDPDQPAPGPATPATRQSDPLIEVSISVGGNVYVVNRGIVTGGAGNATLPAYGVRAGPPVAGAGLSGLAPYQLRIDPDDSLIDSLEDDPLATPPAGPDPADELDGWISFRASDSKQEGLVGFSVDRLFVLPPGTAAGQSGR